MNERPTALEVDALPLAMWRTDVKFRFSHCDPAGIVYTPNFFDIFNGVVEDWYQECLGVCYHSLIRRHRTGLGYASAACEFFSTVMMGDVLPVYVSLSRVGVKSFSMTLHAMKEGKEAVRGKFVTVTTTLSDHRSTPIPEELKSALINYQKMLRSN